MVTILNYCMDWKLQVNLGKTKVTIYPTRKPMICYHNISFVEIEVQRGYKAVYNRPLMNFVLELVKLTLS